MRPFTAMRNDTSAAPAGASGGPAQGTAPRLPPGVIAAPAWIRPQSCHAPPRPILLPHYHAPPRPILLPHNHAPPTRPILLPHYHAAPPRPIPFSCSITMRHLLGLFSCSTARTIHDASPALSYSRKQQVSCVCSLSKRSKVAEGQRRGRSILYWSGRNGKAACKPAVYW